VSDALTEISAHRAGESPRAYQDAVALGADYVEIDVRRTGDGELVVHHDGQVRGLRFGQASYRDLCAAAGRMVPRLRDVLDALVGGPKAHLDLKETGRERETVTMAVDVLGPASVVVTSRQTGSIASVKRDFPEVRTALSVGRSWYQRGFVRDFFPLRPIRACGSDWVALNHRLARFGVLDLCGRQDIPVMIWTVNDDSLMRRFLADPRVSVLITDRPRQALRLREGA
jgi:glycerophosphoryl diester phosphodiesterase